MKSFLGFVVVCCFSLPTSEAQGQSQVTFADVFQAIGTRAKDCFTSRVDRVKAVSKALTSVLQGNFNNENSKLKCSSRCVLQNFGVLSADGTLSADTMKKLAEMIPVPRVKALVLDRIDVCVEDAEGITNHCQKAATVTMCVAKNGVLTIANLPKTMLDGLQLLPKLLQSRLGVPLLSGSS